MNNPSNYQQVKTNLENMLNEHLSKYPNSEIQKDFNFGEKSIIKHALDHINVVISHNDPEYEDTNTGQIKHQSDTVKESLDETTRTNY